MTSPRILIIRLSALGDILHALPVLGALRAAWPGAHVGWMVESGGAPLLGGHPLIDRLHVFPKKQWRQDKWGTLRGPLRELLAEVRAEKYQIAIDAQGLTKSAIWGWLSRAPRRIGFAGRESRELAGLLNNERVLPPPEALHVVERNLALLRPLGIPMPNPVVAPVHLPAASREKATAMLGESSPDRPLVLISPGAGWATKIWPSDRFGKLARLLADRHGCRVAFAWGPGEEPLVRVAMEAAGLPREANFDNQPVPSEQGVYVLPPTTFVELGAAIERAALFVGGDTGPTHLAAALETPTVSMMGPLDARRNGPYGPRSTTIQHAIPRRAPKWVNHRRWCDPRTDLRDVTVDEVFAACEAKLGAG